MAGDGGSRGHQLPIDRGWAWVVVVGAAALCGIQGSTLKIGGLIVVFMRDHFADEQPLILWVVGLSGPVAMIFGPLLSLLIRKTSHRFVAVAGSFAAAAGTAITGYLPTLKAGFFTYSLMNGCGMVALYLVSFTCTAPYFDRHRGTAMGLTSAGTGVLSLVLPNVLTSLHEAYGFSGAMLLYGGIILQGVVFAILIRPTSYYESCDSKANAPLEQVVARRVISVSSVSDRPIDDDEQFRTSIPLRDAQLEKVEGKKQDEEKQQPKNLIVQSKKAATAAAKTTMPAADDCHKRGVYAPASATNDVSGAPVNDAGYLPLGVAALLRSEGMWIVGIAMHFAVNALCIAFTVIPLRGDAIGVPRAITSVLIAVSGGVEIGFRGLQGWLSDRQFAPTLVQFGLSAGAAGVCAALCPLVGGVAGLGLAAVAFGGFAMPLYTLLVLVLRELLGIDRAASALGLIMPLQILSYLMSVFVLGYLAEHDSSWRYIFYYIAANFMLSSALCMVYSLRMKMQREASDHRKSAP